jgi:hypothetical protein
MTPRLALPALLSFFLVGANAQAPQTNPPADAQSKPAADGDVKPPARETPPDQKAYDEASKITDPAKKIEALEKLKKDFPESSFTTLADSAILSTLATKMPGETAKIRQTAQAMYKAAEAKDKRVAAEKHSAVTRERRGSTAQTIASSLLSGNVLMKDAESYAKKSVDAMSLPLYLAAQREAYANRKQNVPGDAELTRRFKEQRASRVATLGRIELKLGKTAAAKKYLTESYGVNNANIAVAAALGEIAAQEGNDAKAFDYLMTAKLGGRIPDSANTAFETIYKKQHNGSLNGLETMLDTEYGKRFPNPVHPEVYKPTEKRTGRVVLAEIFTGSGCRPAWPPTWPSMPRWNATDTRTSP